jgi:hypothetical protein
MSLRMAPTPGGGLDALGAAGGAALVWIGTLL